MYSFASPLRLNKVISPLKNLFTILTHSSHDTLTVSYMPYTQHVMYSQEGTSCSLNCFRYIRF